MHPAMPILSSWSLVFLAQIAAVPLASRPTATAPVPAADPPPPVAREINLSQHFTGYDGCMVIFDSAANTVQRFQPARAAERFSPCSTFKIPNTLIGLETGVIKDAEFGLKWDGEKRSREAHNRDHTLRTAMRDSVVWYFQEVARRIGRERMDQYLHAIGYGNLSTTGPLDTFWINGVLRISADEQVAFLDRLRRGEVPFSRRSIDILKDVTKQSEADGWTLYGKTGTEGRGDTTVLGWFVGWAASKDRAVVFAANMSGDGAMGAKTRAIVLKVLAEQGIPIAP